MNPLKRARKKTRKSPLKRARKKTRKSPLKRARKNTRKSYSNLAGAPPDFYKDSPPLEQITMVLDLVKKVNWMK
ncbi:hypothetical protein 162300236 [Organic Lake phycodnavirus 2]|nr:hypothetical protein 162300236 [Organic Lake phycodnavirus 2]